MERLEALKQAREMVDEMAKNARGYQDENGNIQRKVDSVLRIARFLLNEEEEENE